MFSEILKITPAIVESLVALSNEQDRKSESANKNAVRAKIDEYSMEKVVCYSFKFLSTVIKLPFCYHLIDGCYQLVFDRVLLPVISDDLDILQEL